MGQGPVQIGGGGLHPRVRESEQQCAAELELDWPPGTETHLSLSLGSEAARGSGSSRQALRTLAFSPCYQSSSLG